MPENVKDRSQGPRSRGIQPFWSGVISFGLVNIPVDLFPATRRTRASLRMLGPAGTPLRRRYFDPAEEQLVDTDEIVRGYELEDDGFVIVDEDELDAIAPKKSREIDLRRFVDLADISPLFFDRSYFLTPSGESTKAYRLLTEVMEKTNRSGIATFVMRGKEYLVAILSEKGILRAQTLRFEEEIRSPAYVGLPERDSVDDDLVGSFESAIEKHTEEELDPSELEDRWTREVERLVESKKKSGKDVVRAAVAADGESEEEAEPEEETDLLETIRRRLQSSNGQAPSEEDDDLESLTKDELYARAQEADIPGRSKMTKQELIRALRERE